jgi:hypothetical protein
LFLFVELNVDNLFEKFSIQNQSYVP